MVRTSKSCPWRCVKPVRSYVLYASTKKVKKIYMKNKVKEKIEKKFLADPVKRLPHELNLIIFSYLRNTDLSSCTKISSGWKKIVNSSELLQMTMDKERKYWFNVGKTNICIEGARIY